jgi:serine/threonine protein kinase
MRVTRIRWIRRPGTGQTPGGVLVRTCTTMPTLAPQEELGLEPPQKRSVASILRDHGPLSIVDAVDVALDVCSELASAHANGVVHGDLGLHRVRTYWPRRPGETVDLFALEDNDTAAFKFRQVAFGGLIPPEKRRGLAVDARSDVWAVGVLLHWMLTGHAPSSPDPEVARKLAAVPGPLLKTLRACLAEVPQARPVSVNDLADALAPYSAAPIERFAQVTRRRSSAAPQAIRSDKDDLDRVLGRLDDLAYKRAISSASEPLVISASVMCALPGMPVATQLSEPSTGDDSARPTTIQPRKRKSSLPPMSLPPFGVSSSRMEVADALEPLPSSGSRSTLEPPTQEPSTIDPPTIRVEPADETHDAVVDPPTMRAVSGTSELEPLVRQDIAPVPFVEAAWPCDEEVVVHEGGAWIRQPAPAWTTPPQAQRIRAMTEPGRRQRKPSIAVRERRTTDIGLGPRPPSDHLPRARKLSEHGMQPPRIRKASEHGMEPARIRKASEHGMEPARIRKASEHGMEPARIREASEHGMEPARIREANEYGMEPAREHAVEPRMPAEDAARRNGEQRGGANATSELVGWPRAAWEPAARVTSEHPARPRAISEPPPMGWAPAEAAPIPPPPLLPRIGYDTRQDPYAAFAPAMPPAPRPRMPLMAEVGPRTNDKVWKRMALFGAAMLFGLGTAYAVLRSENRRAAEAAAVPPPAVVAPVASSPAAAPPPRAAPSSDAPAGTVLGASQPAPSNSAAAPASSASPKARGTKRASEPRAKGSKRAPHVSSSASSSSSPSSAPSTVPAPSASSSESDVPATREADTASPSALSDGLR